MRFAEESSVQVSRQGLHTETAFDDDVYNAGSSLSSGVGDSDEERDRIDGLLQGVESNVKKQRAMTFEEKLKPEVGDVRVRYFYKTTPKATVLAQ